VRIETRTGLVYDEADPLCSLTVATTQGQRFAFLVAIDTGHDGQQRRTAPYWGRYDPDAPAESVRAILATGGPWPKLAPERLEPEQ